MEQSELFRAECVNAQRARFYGVVIFPFRSPARWVWIILSAALVCLLKIVLDLY